MPQQNSIVSVCIRHNNHCLLKKWQAEKEEEEIKDAHSQGAADRLIHVYFLAF